MNTPRDRLVFNDVYEVIAWLSQALGHAAAYDVTAERLDDAHNYVQQYCMPEGWGRNVWHTILDDAIRLRNAESQDHRS